MNIERLEETRKYLLLIPMLQEKREYFEKNPHVKKNKKVIFDIKILEILEAALMDLYEADKEIMELFIQGYSFNQISNITERKISDVVNRIVVVTKKITKKIMMEVNINGR